MSSHSELKGGRAIVIVLKYGSLFATLVMALGIAMLLARGAHIAPETSHPISLGVLLSRLLRLEPLAVLEAGILLLLFTPIARIVVAIIGFAMERDLKFVLISLGVLAVVVLSISFAIET
jgi:uncharacterized protein